MLSTAAVFNGEVKSGVWTDWRRLETQPPPLSLHCCLLQSPFLTSALGNKVTVWLGSEGWGAAPVSGPQVSSPSFFCHVPCVLLSLSI